MKHFYTKFFAAFLFLCDGFNAEADRVYSIQNGEWYHTSTWNSGILPLPSDSVVVSHYVRFSDSIRIASSGDLVIDSCGTLCGNHCLNGHFTNYGNMYIGCFNITAPSYNYDTIISNNTSGSGVFTGFLITYNYVYVGPNMPPCIVPPNLRSVGACNRVLSTNDYSKSSPSFSLFPNPATDELTITTQGGNSSPFDINIYDVAGKCLRTYKNIPDNMADIDVRLLPPGYYLLKLTTGHQRPATKGFIIAR